jgi:putative Holliday junction resolvase
MAILAIDFGRLRIGLAVAESINAPAYPLGTLHRSSMKQDLEQILRMIDSRGVTQIVVGLPLNMDGTEGPSARAARNFGAQIGTRLGLPVYYSDERLSSFEARARLSEQGSLRRRKPAIDALAAAIILEQWLAGQRNPS